MRWCTLVRTALHRTLCQIPARWMEWRSAHGRGFLTKGLPMGSLVRLQRPAVWPAMLEEDIVDIFDNILMYLRAVFCAAASSISAGWCRMIDLYRRCRRGSMCVKLTHPTDCPRTPTICLGLSVTWVAADTQATAPVCAYGRQTANFTTWNPLMSYQGLRRASDSA